MLFFFCQMSLKRQREDNFFEAVTCPVFEKEDIVPSVTIVVPTRDKVQEPLVVQEVTPSGFRVTKRATWPECDKRTLAKLMVAADSLAGTDEELCLACAIAEKGQTRPEAAWHNGQGLFYPEGFMAVICPTSAMAFMALIISRDMYENRPMFTFVAYDSENKGRLHRWLTLETVVNPQVAFAVFVRRCVKHFGKDVFDIHPSLEQLPTFSTLFGLETLTMHQHAMDCEHDAAAIEAQKRARVVIEID